MSDLNCFSNRLKFRPLDLLNNDFFNSYPGKASISIGYVKLDWVSTFCGDQIRQAIQVLREGSVASSGRQGYRMLLPLAISLEYAHRNQPFDASEMVNKLIDSYKNFLSQRDDELIAELKLKLIHELS